MSELQNRLNYLAYTVPFTHKVELDEYDFNDIRSALATSTRVIVDARHDLDDIEYQTTTITDFCERTEKQIDAAIKLAEVNNLPKHFVEAFTHILAGAKDHIDTVKKNKVDELIAAVINNLDNADIFEE